ncbi:SLOG family protein [Pseudomonas aeruginosa]|uniref:SLOG family protein n=1 Tax=Pseudomonas aeruginosa TaxID=287 RepID=UPI00071B86EE|nr:SLOG family protein [Pseudomonas aeruginosa]MDU0386162.1 SLOG family protein [Pseudomonas aeruginosa]HBO0103420.1 DUF2493 domain-containing protein [Pseudomonas aeruginosa]HBO0205069.1 DUF2493 domain-containing protein [Pseudomonas aeruginosa]HBO1752153.1 DUF2493 domain-containing protein [Pseudomonas aeruginosa]HBO1769707.1 DUF2493 domain-containing protein [Pseudomonas aeruginosa]
MTRQPHYVVVTGGRYFTNKEVIYGALNAVLSEFRKSNKAGTRRFVLVHGAAPGADTLSARWARDCGLAALAVPAEWMTFGRSAGPRRNAEMLEWVPAKLLVAFPGGRGTAHMVALARRRGLPVRQVHIPSSDDDEFEVARASLQKIGSAP